MLPVARLGLVVSELGADQKNELQVKGGLVVEEVKGSAAARADLRRGDIILAIGNAEVASIEQLNEILKQMPKGRSIALLVRRDEASYYLAMKLDEK